MVSSTGSSLAVELAVRGAEITALGAAFMLGAALVIRRWVRRHEAQRARIASVWRPLLTQVALGDGPSQLPTMPRWYPKTYVLEEWNSVQDALRGAPTERLNQFAHAARLDKVALKLIRGRNVASRILAIRALGHLRDASVWKELEQALDSPNALASSCAAAAMVQIDAHRAMPIVLGRLAQHDHWPPEAVARLLQVAGADAVRAPLRALVFSSGQAVRVARVLEWLARGDPALAGDIAAELLRRGHDDPRVVSKALLALQDATLLPSLRRLADSPDLGVRKNLATALGNLGGPEDEQLIVRLMGDPVWWVRYRAAQALTKLRGMTLERLTTIRASLADRFARDMLDHVVAEGPA